MPSLMSRFRRNNAKTQYESANGHSGRRSPHDALSQHRSTHSASSRPSFGRWLKETWLDLLMFVVMGALGLGVYLAHPAPSRSFPIFFFNGEIVYPEFAYPLRNEIIPIWAAALLGTLIPIFVILMMQIRIRSFWDANNAIFGLFYSVITAAVFQVFLKWLIGGLRPHFLAVCEPNILPNGSSIAGQGLTKGSGFGHIMFDRTICTGDQDQIDDSLESFPSGHSTAAFGGLIYLYLYLNAKLKVFSNYHPSYWKLVVTYAPVLGATLIGGSLTIDEYHNWYDVVAGAIIGMIFAFSAYRMVFASVWDFRFNHIPLRHTVPFTYGAAGTDSFPTAMFTRKAGWGDEESGVWGGAPFDIAPALRSSPTRREGYGGSMVHPAFAGENRELRKEQQRHSLGSTHNTLGRKPVPYPKNNTVMV